MKSKAILRHRNTNPTLGRRGIGRISTAMVAAASVAACLLAGEASAATIEASAVAPPEQELIWEIELIEETDLDGDGIVGPPPDNGGDGSVG